MRILIISDVHGNWEALRAVLQEPHDALVFLGDAVHFGPMPHECVDALRARATWSVCGNHDHGAAFQADCRAYGGWRAWDEATRHHTREMLTADDLAYLRELPVIQQAAFGGARVCLVHAAPTDPLYRYLPPDASADALREELVLADADILLVGHTHMQMTRHLDGRVILNPGSVGMPRGGAGAQYAVWDDGELTLRSVAYDVPAVIAQLASLRPPEDILAGMSAALQGRAPDAGPGPLVP